jgi:hypothetical protein
MGMSCLKIINASHPHPPVCKPKKGKYIIATPIYIFFNQKCLRKFIIPNFAKIKVCNTSPEKSYVLLNVHDYDYVIKLC